MRVSADRDVRKKFDVTVNIEISSIFEQLDIADITKQLTEFMLQINQDKNKAIRFHVDKISAMSVYEKMWLPPHRHIHYNWGK
jgi:hypothetical protein